MAEVTDPQIPRGQFREDDAGELQTKIAIDPKTNALFIDYSKPVRWVCLDIDALISLMGILAKSLSTMAGVPVSIVVDTKKVEMTGESNATVTASNYDHEKLSQ